MLHGASLPIIDFREQGKHDGTLVGHRLQFEFRIAQDCRISNCKKIGRKDWFSKYCK